MSDLTLKSLLKHAPSADIEALPVEVCLRRNRLDLYIEGYGNASNVDGEGSPITLDYYQGKLKLLVWGDINSDEPTHIIDLAGALESKRID